MRESNPVIKVEHLSKYYRLGLIGGGTLREDVNRWVAKLQGKPDPLLKIGESDRANVKGDQIWALRDVNFEVKEGEILGIVGGNGAGKSTLLKVLSRITAPTEGRIAIRGRVGSLLEVGTGFHPELTGRENVYLNGTILGMKKAEISAKLHEIVDFAEMGKFIDTPVKRYSSGMTVRLAFAVAAHLEPEILVVDEVLAVGDAAFQKKCLGKMSDISAQGRTVLFVSHNMTAIEGLCTSGLLIAEGKVSFSGDVRECIDRYLSISYRDSVETTVSARYLGDRVRKRGILKRIIDHLTLGDSTSESPIIRMGGALVVSVRFNQLVHFNGLKIGIAIRDDRSDFVCHFTSAMDVPDVDEKQTGVQSATATLRELPLTPGKYSLDVALFYSNGSVLDHVEDAIYFQVVEADVYGNGCRVTREHGRVL